MAPLHQRVAAGGRLLPSVAHPARTPARPGRAPAVPFDRGRRPRQAWRRGGSAKRCPPGETGPRP